MGFYWDLSGVVWILLEFWLAYHVLLALPHFYWPDTGKEDKGPFFVNVVFKTKKKFFSSLDIHVYRLFTKNVCVSEENTSPVRVTGFRQRLAVFFFLARVFIRKSDRNSQRNPVEPTRRFTTWNPIDSNPFQSNDDRWAGPPLRQVGVSVSPRNATMPLTFLQRPTQPNPT